MLHIMNKLRSGMSRSNIRDSFAFFFIISRFRKYCKRKREFNCRNLDKDVKLCYNKNIIRNWKGKYRCACCLFSVTTICRVCNQSFHRFAVLERMQTLCCRVRENTVFYCYFLPVHVLCIGHFYLLGGDRMRQTDFARYDAS